MSRLRRVKRIEQAWVKAHPPPDWPGVVFVIPAIEGRPPGCWVRRDGAVEVLVYDTSKGPAPRVRFPGRPLVLGGEIDPFRRCPQLRTKCQFIPA